MDLQEEGWKMTKSFLMGSTLCLFFCFSCIPQPRYTTESVQRREDQGTKKKESAKQQLNLPSKEKSKSKIDKKKMGRIVDSFLGSPYKYGGQSKNGIDCSGLVVEVYKRYAGFDLPRSTKKLYKLVRHVDRDDLVYGDLVFFSDGWFSVSHVGIYVEEGRFVHSIKDFGVIVSSLEEDYYKKRYRGARRVIP
jgi:cell wall-associated NlpC family hydrolase